MKRMISTFNHMFGKNQNSLTKVPLSLLLMAFLFFLNTQQVAAQCSLSTSITEVSHVTCNGADDGSITLEAQVNQVGIPARYITYLWSNGALTKNISGLAPGPYSVTVSEFTTILGFPVLFC